MKPSFPFCIAHRGAGRFAPENTKSAFELGLRAGFRMFECDVRLSQDEVVVLLHDATLERTTSGYGAVNQTLWSRIATLDAGRWFDEAYTHERIWRLENLLAFALEHDVGLNIEIKAESPMAARRTAEKVVLGLAQYWPVNALQKIMLSSFEIEALSAIEMLDHQLQRALLVEEKIEAGIAQAQTLKCMALVAHHRLWNAQTIAHAKEANLLTWAYTVNDPTEARRLASLGLDSLITDSVFEVENWVQPQKV